MLTVTDMAAILREITFRDWAVRLQQDDVIGAGAARTYLQVVFLEEDMVTRVITEQKGRKWILSQHMTKSEVVATAFKAILTAVEHETREQFRYRGRAIFGPHFDVDALVEFARSKENLDMRTGEWVKAA